MPQAVNSNQALYIWVRDFLQENYADKNIDNSFIIKTLAMMITGMILGPHVQLFAIAIICVPLMIKLPSLVRRFAELPPLDEANGEEERNFEEKGP